MKLLLIQATLLFQQADLFIQFHMVLHFRLASMGVCKSFFIDAHKEQQVVSINHSIRFLKENSYIDHAAKYKQSIPF